MSMPLRTSPGIHIIRRLLATSIQELSACFLRRLKDAIQHPKGESVHDFRVAMRRLSATLLTAKEITATQSANAALAELDNIMRPLGKLRDAQVLLGLLEKLPKRHRNILSAFIRFLEAREARFRDKSRKMMRKLNVKRIRKLCKAARAELSPKSSPIMSKEQAGSALAHRILLRRYRSVVAYRLRAITHCNPEALHRMRLALKRMRYTAEVLHPLLPQMGQSRLNLLSQFQTYLGDIHDLDVLTEKISKFYDERADASVHQAVDRLVARRERIFTQFKRAFSKFEKDKFWTCSSLSVRTQ